MTATLILLLRRGCFCGYSVLKWFPSDQSNVTVKHSNLHNMNQLHSRQQLFPQNQVAFSETIYQCKISLIEELSVTCCHWNILVKRWRFVGIMVDGGSQTWSATIDLVTTIMLANDDQSQMLPRYFLFSPHNRLSILSY